MLELITRMVVVTLVLSGCEDPVFTGPRDGGPADAGEDAGPGCGATCELVSQCGCGGGEACTFAAVENECRMAGPAGVAERCAADADCAAGLVCLSLSGAGLCHRFCEADGDCASGSLCWRNLRVGEVLRARACTNPCDPVDDRGCPAETRCFVRPIAFGEPWPHTDCTALAPTAALGEACEGSWECPAGHGCAEDASCRRWCRGDADCPGRCEPVYVTGPAADSVTYGFCVP